MRCLALSASRQLCAGIAFVIMVVIACQPLPATPTLEPTALPMEVRVGPLRRVSQVPYVFEPHIAVDPTDANHLAAVVISASQFECIALPQGECQVKLVLYTSRDGGITWIEQLPFERSITSWDGVVAFGPDGTLYVTGLAGSTGGSVFIAWADAEGKVSLSTTSAVTSLLGNDKPWLTIDPHDGTLYVVYDGPTSSQYQYDGVLLTQSTDRAKNWAAPVIVDRGVELSAVESGQVLAPFGAQVMLGADNNLAIAWIWAPGFDTFRTGVWVATSSDKGQTFSAAKQIAETWGGISTAYQSGDYYIFYRRGTEGSQELVVAISRDGGSTWTTSSVSRDLPLYFDIDKAPGVNVAPNGTIDVMFYAHGEGAPGCIDVPAFRKRRDQGWIDQCIYDVYYTFSKDGGQTFHVPIKLNGAPILGSRFLRTRGVSRPGEYMGMASANESAYPIWIDTQGTEGTQAYTVQIER